MEYFPPFATFAHSQKGFVIPDEAAKVEICQI
jgi:hypothetical protein